LEPTQTSTVTARPRWRRPRWLIAAGCGALLGVYCAHVALWRPLAVGGVPVDDGYARMAGVVHVHTTYSDGGGTPEEVVAAARAAGLGFVNISDHNVLDAKPLEGYHDGVLTLVGAEISAAKGHVLALGIRDPAYRFWGDPVDIFDDVRSLGGFAFISHPLTGREDLRWGHWDVKGPWGLEILNGDSQWRQAGPFKIARSLLLYGLNRRYALLTSLVSSEETLALWDRLLAERDVPALYGADAHNRLALGKKRGLRFPSYEAAFSLARDHVLLDGPLVGELEHDRALWLDAIRRGRLYVGLDALAPANDVSFVAEGAGRRWTMGDTAPPLPDLRLRVAGRMPAGAVIRLVRDGQEVARRVGELTWDVGTTQGVYRVEVYVPGWRMPWILTNPIYVFDAAAAAARAERGRWPEPAPAPPERLAVETFAQATDFHCEADAASGCACGPSAGPDPREKRTAFETKFRLAAPGPGRPDTWCAVVSRKSRDWTGMQGLRFSIRADGEYRLFVQVRDENAASTDDGQEWWQASVRTATAWRTVALPFSRFRSDNPHTHGRLDPARVRGVVFLIDRGAMKIGSQGTVWIDDVGVY
jgi:hypothetical protein